MRKLILCLLAILITINFIKGNKIVIKKVIENTPFGKVIIKYPYFNNCKVYDIREFGAISEDKNKNTLAISLAIEEANKAGGGIVLIPKGEWLTGKIHFKSNVNLHFEDGAKLIFSEIPADYLPPVHTSWEGLECYNYSPLIYAYNCKNIAITGNGEIIAKMDIWKQWFSRPKGHMENLKNLYYMAVNNVPVEKRNMINDSANLRPQFIQINRSENVLIENITITNSPFWTIHTYLTKNVIIRNVKIKARGHNNDGIDPEMTQNMLIENCVFDQGDDAISIKSGREFDGWRINVPSKNIIIKNCKVINGHQLLAIGSELSGGIENIYLENCTVEDGAKLFHLLYIKTNERRGGYVKNIYMKNVNSGKIDNGILGIETDVLYQWKNLLPTIERRLTPISNIYLENVKSKEVKYISKIKGEKELPIQNVKLINVFSEKIIEIKHIHENITNFIEN